MNWKLLASGCAFWASVALFGALPLLAGERSDAFVAAARKAYAADPMCRATIVTNFVVKGTPDDKAPGLVRWYDVEGARNVRDIGGWTGLRAGRVFRGTELNSKPNHKQYELTERGRAVMRGEMGIVSDLDLRGEIAEYGEDAKTKSPIGEGVQLLSRAVSSYVEICTSPRSAKAFAAALRVFTDEKNYPVYVHCAGGADRTGTVCFLLETLCGVSLEDATIEYELTSFSPVGMRRRNSETGLPFALMVRLLSGFPGETFADKVTYWAENVAGLTKDEIARIRANLVNAPGAAAVALAAGAKTVDAKGVVVNGKTVRETERRDFADGSAVRYVLPEGERRIEREDTVWTLPLDAKVWYQEYGMDYEKPYCSSLVSEIPVGTVMDFPVTAKLADGTYRLITEANVVGYTDSAAKYLGEGRFGVFYANDPDGFDQKGADTTPWRVMLVAKDLQTLATSDIVRRLCPAPSAEVAAKAAKFVRPGRAVWQWLPAGAPKYGEQKEWYDRTKALGFEYYLIDDGWRDWCDGDMDQWACLKKWIDYGKSIGVETFMWVDSKEMRNPETRRGYLAKVKASGAVGIKIDFHPAPSCEQMAWYEEALADTLEFGLMTDYHGCVKPSGREKTWPHEVAREAIRGHEWHITRYNRVLPPEHDCILPFNRLVQGHADYTPVVFEEKELAGYTRARELAQGIIFSAPFLCLGDYPKNYLESPAVEIIKALEPVYDETIVLPGSEIGECVAVAKRKGEKWFIAIENGAEDRSLEIPLSFLRSGKWKMKKFADAENSNTEFDISEFVVVPSDTLKLALRAKGGFVAVLYAESDCTQTVWM